MYHLTNNINKIIDASDLGNRLRLCLWCL